MEIKFITKEKAIELGLAKPSETITGRAGPEFMYSVVGKTNPDGTRDTKNILEIHRTCIKTGKQDVLYEHPDYKKEKKRLKINEYKVDDHK